MKGKKKNVSKERKKKISNSSPKLKKKQKKRLNALSEVFTDESSVSDTSAKSEDTLKDDSRDNTEEKVTLKDRNEDQGILGKVKEFYKKADNMASAQALLLNKKLEDSGVVDKITDESGLRVIGKEAASKLNEEKDKKDDNSAS